MLLVVPVTFSGHFSHQKCHLWCEGAFLSQSLGQCGQYSTGGYLLCSTCFYKESRPFCVF